MKKPNDFEVGDLVYVPSEVVMFNEAKTLKLKEPSNLLVTGKQKGYYEVYFKNKKWLVERNNVYEVA